MPRTVKPPPGTKLLACLVTCLLAGACSRPAPPTAMTLRKTFRTQLDVSVHGKTGTALDRATGPELWMRNPVSFVESLRVPTQIIEGAEEGNTGAFEPLRKAAKGAPLSFLAVPGATHFSVLAPVTELLARKLAEAPAEAPAVSLTDAEVREAMRVERDR
ncbi:hypothetical protein G4177_16250 [Corallococcus sp. ZKHCc1 1396]|uniref:Alpha/beta hydrolase n=1 Tax=Corallococcus soli TaxID=2710757 RepID=A0ABR9PP65_9BACT|nr:hypothetical protein [Corallococcus soli]MBE4749717.1 hypothetical protein [Corallococcus soli]